MIGVGVVTFLAGLLFGYDQGVISGALPLLQADLDLSTIESEIITGWVTLGALCGALVAGGTADRIGSVATAVNWLSAFLVAQFFLSVVAAIGESTTFFIFSALCIVTFVFVWYVVPETKGRSLEEIRERWVMKGDRMLEEEHVA
jgi:MFS family permease